MDARLILIRAWEYNVKRIRLLPLIVGVISLMLTALSVIAVERSDKVARQLRIQVETDQVAAMLQQNIATQIAILRSGRALFAALKTVDLPTFQRFVGELDVKGGNLGVRGIGWSVRVNREDVARLEQGMRAKGVDGFRVWPRLPPSFASE